MEIKILLQTLDSYSLRKQCLIVRVVSDLLRGIHHKWQKGLLCLVPLSEIIEVVRYVIMDWSFSVTHQFHR